MRAGGPLAQHSVSVRRNVFDLHARHGAILALPAPQYKSTGFDVGPLLSPPPQIVPLRWTQRVSPPPETHVANVT